MQRKKKGVQVRSKKGIGCVFSAESEAGNQGLKRSKPLHLLLRKGGTNVMK